MKRWDPRTRAGAIAVRAKSAHDTEAMKALADNVREWASYQKLAGEIENVETSPITGTYDWKAYLHEEAQAAQARETERKPVPKKPAKPARAEVAPAHWYV